MIKVLLMSFLLSTCIFVGFGKIVEAEENDLAITVVKYKITDPTQVEGQLPLDGTKAQTATDKEGNQLIPLAGVSYVITRVSPEQGTTHFRPVEGSDSYTTRITTDANGVARVSGLAQGSYQVVEEANEQIKKVMEPIIFELPLPQRTGDALKEVFLYPKSSVFVNEKTSTKKTGRSSGEGVPERLPQTSGNIGTYGSLVIILAFLSIMGLLGGGLMRKSKKYY